MQIGRRAAATFAKLEKPGGERLLVGVVMRPEVFDAHNDLTPADVLRHAAHDFLADYQGDALNLQHVADTKPDADLVESFIADMDGEQYGYSFQKGDWVIAVRINSDSLWEQCKDGTFNAFSPEGDMLAQYLDETAQFAKSTSGEAAGDAASERPRKRILAMQVRAIGIVDHGANRIDYATIVKRHKGHAMKTKEEENKQQEQTPAVTEPVSSDKPAETKVDPPAEPAPADSKPVDAPKQESDPSPAPAASKPVAEEMAKERRMTKTRRAAISAAITEAESAAAKLKAILEETEESDDSSEPAQEAMSKAFESKVIAAETRATNAESALTALKDSFTKSEEKAAKLEQRVAEQNTKIAEMSKALEEIRSARPAPATAQGHTIEAIKKNEDSRGTFDGLIFG